MLYFITSIEKKVCDFMGTDPINPISSLKNKGV